MESGPETETASETNIIIENKPPFFDHLKSLIDVPVETILQESKRYEKPYLAFQAVRHVGMGYVGFEPYLLGNASMDQSWLLEDAKQKIRELNKNPELKRMIVQTLREEQVFIPALTWLSSELGALTARLRAQTSLHAEASSFRSNLYGKLENSSISYTMDKDSTKQRYILPQISIPTTASIAPSQSESMFSPEEYLSLLGKVGHPLVRASLRHLK